ncbi:YqfQ-like protein [Gracilibacillus orientalis]|uniref:YqfQ-like protein n=1 Tax=Gracilibacillus orientalis TaxID=334253 RepID=A0A1I4L5H2_9BACI|nr:VrrA/YqfQ family protein [Gracilibacillus orientalis]SFL86230.1 YqfQ-like protein [Gracilibacillus orientalis]
MFRPPNQPPMFSQQNIPTQGLFPRGPVPNQMTNPTGLQGLLQRFLPSQASNMTTQATNVATGGGSNLMGTINNVQQVLKVAQQATPLIKEYGPMIKNAPKLINMMKALNEINDDDEEVQGEEEAEELDITESTPTSKKQVSTNSAPIRTSESQPKLFI